MKILTKTACLLAGTLCFFLTAAQPVAKTHAQQSFIKWVDCNVPAETLKQAYDMDVKYHAKGVDCKFTEVLAYLATKNGNNFSAKADTANLKKLAERLDGGDRIADIYGDNKYYQYYTESYGAIFAQYVGEYFTEEGKEAQYGLKTYFPLARGYWYSHYDDFGNSRNFGFKRRHTGHDIMGSVGTPIVAVEGGTVQELGWNRYGGWRIGIRSRDTKRYYYYAHLRKDRPYASDLKRGDTVEAGQVIGYLGNTGYSSKENQNLKTGQPHLHVGLQLIFDESQVQGNNEIWVDFYQISKFLTMNRAQTVKDKETGAAVSVHLRRGSLSPDKLFPEEKEE